MEEIQKSPHIVLILDEKRNKIMSLIYATVCQIPEAKLAFNVGLRMHNINESEITSFVKDWTRKEHDAGWCNDPRCPSKQKYE